MSALTTEQTKAYNLIPELKALWREHVKAGRDWMGTAIQIGGVLNTMKELLPHGEFMPFVEQHFEFSHDSAGRYMKAANAVKRIPATMKPEDFSINELIKIGKVEKPQIPHVRNLEERKPVDSNGLASDSISEKGKPGGDANSSKEPHPASAAPDPGEAADSSGEEGTERETSSQETDPRPPRSGKERNSAPGKVDYGKCPNCAGTKWNTDEFGMVDCAKCLHPWGEPADSQPEEKKDHGDDLRAKAAKTMEAAMRVFDDLNLLIPKAGLHKQVIELCKNLLKSAKSWK